MNQIIGLIAFFSVMPAVADATRSSVETRVGHARELLGRGYHHSVVKQGEEIRDVANFIEAMTRKCLPAQHQKKARTVANAILRESEANGFDPIFVMAVIQNESRFNPEMRGLVGEIGLMQIRPTTAEWFAKIRRSPRLKWKGEAALFDPVENIRFGTAYMAYMRDKFDGHSRLYISAYNMGARKVRMLVNEDRTPKEYVQAVMKRYVAMYQAFTLDAKLGDQINFAHNQLLDLTRQVAAN